MNEGMEVCCKMKMDWKDFRKRYSVFLASLQQTELIFYRAAKAIPDNPTKVQEDSKVEIPFLVNFFRQSFRQVSGGYHTDHMLLDIEPVIHIVFDGKKERLLAYHELSMIMAHLEAFITDTLRSIWLQNPSILESTASGREALKNYGVSTLSALNSEQLERITDNAIWDIMRKSSQAYLRYLADVLLLSIKTDDKVLYRADLDRNAIVHNGGIITQDKYIDKLNDKERRGLIAGEHIAINAEYIIQISNLVQSLGETIFEEVSKKHFRVSEPLTESERVVNRESLAKERNPLEDVAFQAIANVGGPDKAATDPQRAKAEMIRLKMERNKKDNKK